MNHAFFGGLIMRRRFAVTLAVIFLFICGAVDPLHAFDDDISLNEPNFHPENFLDMKAYAFGKSADDQWLAAGSGWRMTGGSLGLNLSYVDSEIRLHQRLSDYFSIRFDQAYRVYYAIKPLEHPLLDIGWRPFGNELELSFIGTAAHDKRQSDLGYALSWGDQPGDYIRVSWLSVDHFYNEKNVMDDAYYEDQPTTVTLDMAGTLADWRLRLSIERDSPLTLVMPLEGRLFRHNSENAEMLLDYVLSADESIGIELGFWITDKALADTTSDRVQSLGHRNIDIYWVRPFREKDELTLGLRSDLFANRMRNRTDAGGSYDYLFSTTQLYAMLQHNYSAHAGWGLGVYIGDVDEKNDYLLNPADDMMRSYIQGKLRSSWTYRSLDERHRFSFHFSFNLDDLWADPGDGAGMSYQGLF